MFECIVAQLAIAYNLHTQEAHRIYRCEGSKKFKYLDRPDKIFKGYYDINNNIFIITNERKCV